MKEYNLDQGTLIFARCDFDKTTTLKDIEHIQMEFGKHQECCIYDKYFTITDFINGYEKLEERVKKLEEKC